MACRARARESLALVAALCCALPRHGFAETTCVADPGQSRFERWFDEYERAFDGPFIGKYRHYFDIYEQHMAKFRRQERVRMLELGVRSGGSLRMWKEYFGDALELHGIDINPNSKIFQDTANNVHVHIGSLADEEFMRGFARTTAPFDIILHDASHHSSDQKLAFEVLYPTLQPRGVYIVEDVHTNYWNDDRFSEGVGVATTFIEHCKQLIDSLNKYNFDSEHLTEFTRTTYSLTFYDSVVVIEKRPHAPPEAVAAGSLSVPDPLQNVILQSRRALEDDDNSVQIHVANPDLDRPAISPVHVDTRVVIDPTGRLAQDVLAAPERWWTCAQIDETIQCVRIDVALGQTIASSSSVEDVGPVALSVAQHTITVWLERRVQLAERQA